MMNSFSLSTPFFQVFFLGAVMVTTLVPQSYSKGKVVKTPSPQAMVKQPSPALSKNPHAQENVTAKWAGRQRLPQKKKNFVLTIFSLICQENKRILSLRQQVEAIKAKQRQKKPWKAEEKRLVAKLRLHYKAQDLGEILEKMDIIPPSLALAQAIEESDWGGYPLAKKHNSCFGMCRTKTSLISYPNLKACVVDYMNNYNCHPAYKHFRKLRSAARQKKITLTGSYLIPGLRPYSTNPRYFLAMGRIIRCHDLHLFDGVSYGTYAEDFKGVWA